MTTIRLIGNADYDKIDISHLNTSRKVAGSISDEVIKFLQFT
jgi:hypothetical protein